MGGRIRLKRGFERIIVSRSIIHELSSGGSIGLVISSNWNTLFQLKLKIELLPTRSSLLMITAILLQWLVLLLPDK